MPIEKRPSSPGRGPFATGSRNPPYKVTDADSFETVAQKFKVSTTDLIQHNFRTMDPAEINWYLREYVGCNKPTTDGKNWCFSGSARPGLVYVPNGGAVPDPGEGKVPNGGGPSINPPDNGAVPIGTKLVLKHKFPMQTVN